MTIQTANFVDAYVVFRDFKQPYQEFWEHIRTADDKYLTLSYVSALAARMENVGVRLLKKLRKRLDELTEQCPHLYVDLEPW